MRILILGPAREGDLAWHVARALRSLGHQVTLEDLVHSDSEDPLWSRARWKIPRLNRGAIRWMNLRTQRLCRNLRPELVLICKGRYLLPDTLQAIRRSGIPTVNWYPDGIGEMEREFIIECLPYYTFFFTKDLYLCSRLRSAGVNAHHLPLACDPEIHRTWELSEEDRRRYESDLSLVGSGYPFRKIHLPLLEGYQVKLWGSGWRERLNGHQPSLWQGRSVRGVEQAKVFNATKININTVHFFEVQGVNRRTFDIAGCGGFQICTAAPEGLHGLFSVGHEVIVAKDDRELRSLIDHYLAHEEERRQIGQGAQRRAHRDHTYRQRMEAILRLLHSKPSER